MLILVTFIAYLTPYINPETFSWVNVLGTIYPWLLLANLLFAGFWIFVKNRYFLFSLACIILGWNHLTNFIGTSFSSPPAKAATVNILTFNTSGFSFLAGGSKEEHLKNVADFTKFINKNGRIDILCIQEVSSLAAQEVNDKLDFKYIHKIPYLGTSILSRYPIVQSGEIEFTTKTNSCVWADIQINNKTVRVYSLHLKSNQVSTETEYIINKGDINEKKTWADIKGVFGKFRYTSKIRVQQAQKVKAHIDKSPHPVILCGDFNETPLSYVYRMLSENLNDSFQKKGLGIGTTYAGSIPALRIDYILSDPGIKILDFKIFKEQHSDHFPIFAILEP